jgi:selenocysteine lyase/cysteine desulfurase
MTIEVQRTSDGARHAAVDVAAERARTTGTRARHYLNAAGTALPSDAVVEAVIEHLRAEQNSGGYEAARAAEDRLDRVYVDAAALLGAAPDEIALVDSATTGLRVIFDALRLRAGDTVIAPRSSYVSQALRLLALQRYDGVELALLPTTPDGTLDLEVLEQRLQAAPGRVVVSGVHIPTGSGLVEPVAEVARLAREHGAVHVLDATQSIGQLDISMADVPCDALVTTGRKFLRGPRGTAIVYARSDFVAGLTPWAPDVRGSRWTGSQAWDETPGARRLETWEAAVASRLGLGVALEEALRRGMAATEAHLVATGESYRVALARIDGVRVVDPPASRSSIVTFVVDGIEPREVSSRLRDAGVDTIAIPASHAQWDLGARGLDAVVRVSPHVYNDDGDLDVLDSALRAIVRRPRG